MDAENEEMPKLSGRRANRLAAIQFIYANELNRHEEVEEGLTMFFMGQEQPRKYYKFAEELIGGTLEHLGEIDPLIEQYSTNWKFDRIAKTDLAVLRVAFYELLHRVDIPPVVTINEAIDLTKMLSGEESKRFVNGILDEFKRTLDRPLRTPKED